MAATMKGNVIVGQSGGPTAVINSSLAGVYKTAIDRGANKVYGMLHGIQGLLEEREGDMLQVVSEPRSDIPAVTHVDYSARIQTVDLVRNPELHGILSEYEKLTGCAVLVNTSFNVRGEPIVCTPKDSYECFMRTDMDVLVLEDAVLYKGEQPEFVEKEDWREKYALD